MTPYEIPDMLYVHVKYNLRGPGENTNLFCCLHVSGRVDLHGAILLCDVSCVL